MANERFDMITALATATTKAHEKQKYSGSPTKLAKLL